MKKEKIHNNLTIQQFNHLSIQSGFTLLEIIIAMAIVAIVSGALWGNFFSSLSKGRDSRRKQDVQAVAKALELYYADGRAYPTALPSWGAPFANQSNTAVIYMQKLPNDPAYPNATYCYTSTGAFYKLYANLENKGDPAVFVTPVLCSTVYYNYGVSSQNTTP